MSSAPVATSNREPFTVLIVDDHELVAQSFARVLRDQPDMCIVGIASTQAAAIEAVRRLQPALVLMDYMLPDGDGASTAQRVARESPATKIIMLTGSGSAAARVAALAAGCAGYLEKTAATPVLLDVVRRVLSGEVVMPRSTAVELPTTDQLAVHYQPIVELQSHAIVGVEALVRWMHPEHGLLLPRQFIGLAEETGYIHELGEWVLAEALDQLARWRRDIPAASSMQMSVNVSARQLERPEFVTMVADLLARSDGASGLTLEVTETMLLDGSAQIRDALDELHFLGVSIALDDFGTGYSSLEYLRRFPIDVLKIDKCFTDDLPYGSRSLLLADAICSLARELAVTTVAEGIETADQAACLRDLGAELGQGYYFRRPQPADMVGRALATPPLAHGESLAV